MSPYLPIFILLAFAMVVAAVVILGISRIGPRKPNKMKNTFFECGVPPSGDAKKRFSVRFYLIAISFLLFDVEVVLLFPWALVYREFLAVNMFILWAMLAFLTILTVAFVYEWRRGGLEWE